MVRVTRLLVVGILFTPAFASAQVAVGTLLGNVTDESAGAVPGATITATEVRTNITRTAVSNAGRQLHLQQSAARRLPESKASSSASRSSRRETVEVSVNTTVRVDISLTVGSARRVADRYRRGAAAADRSHRYGPHHREHADHTDAAGVQPQLPGAAHHGARRVAAVSAAFGVLQLARKPVEQCQRPVAAGQQRAARRRGQQRQRRQPRILYPVSGSDRHRLGRHQQLRRRIRARRRRGDERDDQIRDQYIRGLRFCVWQY